MEGHTLADGLADFPTVFPELYIATVAAGEQSGHLDTVLERLADYTENREQMRSSTITAMLYPVLLFIVCISIVALLLTFVVPKIVKQFENSKAELPMLTQVLIAISDFLRDWGWLLVLGIIAIGFCVQALVARSERETPLPRHTAAITAVRKSGPRLEHRALRSDFLHIDLECGASAGSVAHLRRSGHQPADARRRSGCGDPRARRRTDRQIAGPGEDISADDDPPHLQRRIQRRAGDHAGPRSDQPGARR